jgi:hypothetical protein
MNFIGMSIPISILKLTSKSKIYRFLRKMHLGVSAKQKTKNTDPNCIRAGQNQEKAFSYCINFGFLSYYLLQTI